MSPAQPFYFGQPACLGWWHAAEAPQGLPVLICGPVGAEDLSAHRMLRLAAESLAAQGVPCLRFDPLGSGDSAPVAVDDDAVPGWLDSVHAAIDALRAATGASQVAILGLRLGATLAALAAHSRSDVAAFAAWVPVPSGRAMLREWKMLGAAGLPSVTHADGSLETGGFRYAGATCVALGQLNVLAPLVRPAPRMLVIDRSDLPVAAGWCEALRASGVQVDEERLPGYEGLMAVPHLTVLPEAMLARGVAWLVGLTGLTGMTQAPCAAASRQPVAELAHTAWLQIQGVSVCERPVRLPGSGAEPALLALRSEWAGVSEAAPRTAVLVLNTGAERRVGPHGQFVTLARHLAASGALVLRLDLAGLGDSPARPGCDEHRVYPPQAMDDLRRALAYLQAQAGVQRVVALGLCSGAFHAFEAAANGLVLDAAVLINPLVFFRPERVDFDAVPAQDHAVQQLSGEALRNLRDPARWLKLVKGEVNLRFIGQTLGRRLGLAGKRLQRAALRQLGRPQADDLAAKLRRAAQGPAALAPRLCFVFAQGDPGLALLNAEAGRALRALQRQGHVRVVPVAQADHTFSRAEARLRLQDVLDEVLGLAPVLQASRTAAQPVRAVRWGA